MNFQLIRIDDRLIHAQVVFGWGTYLHPEKIILCDDNISKDENQKSVYASQVIEGIENLVLSVEDLVQAVKDKKFENEKIMLIVGSIDTVVRIIDKGVVLNPIYIGGIHQGENRKQILPYIYLNDDEIKKLKKFKDLKIEVFGQDLPTSKRVNLFDLI
jgi:mannose/fructose/N-acetylgalactosamine-specific phosphotransferase system component IIB